MQGLSLEVPEDLAEFIHLLLFSANKISKAMLKPMLAVDFTINQYC